MWSNAQIFAWGCYHEDNLYLGVDVCEKEGVDERRFAQARLADHHQTELEAIFHRLAVELVGQVCETLIFS